ncbi:MAG: hypothetical protein RLZZ403_1375 [Pseudomonadota bacterium]
MTAVEVQLAGVRTNPFGTRACAGTHALHEHALFTDEALADLLDHFPRQHLYALSMGLDLARPDQNRLAATDGVSGAELLRAVANGRLWLNVTRVDLADARYRQLIDRLFGELVSLVPGFNPIARRGTLLISSPRAMVYYHADAAPTLLWQIRGRKRIWIYPALNERFLKRELLEDIFTGVRHEYVPYDAAFDNDAVSYDLDPGQWITWPQNAPHRVTNLDSVNVSLTTEYVTAETRRRGRVYAANRFFRTRLHATNLSARETGGVALGKVVIHRVASRLGLDPLRCHHQTPVLRIDAAAPDGVRPLG